MYRVVNLAAKPFAWTLQSLLYSFYRGIQLLYAYNCARAGSAFAHNAYREYAWLGSSMALFPDRHELTEMFSRAGFKDIKVKAYCGGVAVMHLGCK